jgi:hypothetical protein
MYKYMDLRGGKLVDTYTDHGAGAVKLMIREEVESFLYNGGKGGHLSKVDWIRWRSRLRARMEVSLSYHFIHSLLTISRRKSTQQLGHVKK